MVSRSQLLVLALSLFMSISLSAQTFSPAFAGASHKKVSYLTMEDGSTIEGTIKKLKYEKGLIEEVKLLDMNDEKIKIKPEKIKHMYLPQSGFAKFAKAYEFLHDATQWDDVDLDKDIIGKGYIYFEKSKVRIKKKTQTLMVQLVNPSFSGKIQVYTDPFAGETASLGVGGVKFVGGDEKSYYIKKKDVAYKLKKKNYDEEFKNLFGDCKSMMKKYGKSPKWSEFEQHVYEYAKECN